MSAKAHLDMLRTNIRTTNSANWRITFNNARAHVGNALYLIKPTPEIDTAASDAIAQTQKFAEEARDLFSLQGIQSRQTAALEAVDKLATLLETAAPSDVAKALGLGF